MHKPLFFIYVLMNVTTGYVYSDLSYPNQGACEIVANNFQNVNPADQYTCVPAGTPLPAN